MGGNLCKGEGTPPNDFDGQCNYLKTRYKLSDEKITEFKTLFSAFSSDSKVINRENFRRVYIKVYNNQDATGFADRVFDAFDKNKGGTVDFVEFCEGLTMIDSKLIEEKISIAFSMFDEDKNYSLSKEEVTNMLQAYYTLFGPNLSELAKKCADELFERMDKDKDQKVTYDEFTKAALEDPKVFEILDPQA